MCGASIKIDIYTQKLQLVINTKNEKEGDM